MDTTIIVAAFSLVGTLVGSWLASSKTTAVMQEQIKDIKEDIDTLGIRVDQHNNLTERMAATEQSMKLAHHRLDELERRGHEY